MILLPGNADDNGTVDGPLYDQGLVNGISQEGIFDAIRIQAPAEIVGDLRMQDAVDVLPEHVRIARIQILLRDGRHAVLIIIYLEQKCIV